MPLAVVQVTGDPPLSVVAGGSAGVPLHAQLHSGACRVEKPTAKLFEGRGPARLGFFVPGAGPFRPSHLLSAWAEVSLARAQIAASDLAQSGPYGVDDVAVQLVDDGRGSGSVWPYVWLTAWGGEPMLLRYRVTVTQPLENA